MKKTEFSIKPTHRLMLHTGRLPNFDDDKWMRERIETIGFPRNYSDSPAVMKLPVRRIVMCSAPSTGKTTAFDIEAIKKLSGSDI